MVLAYKLYLKNVDFINSDNKWYEVEALAQDKVFIPDPGKKGDTPGIKVGKWVNTNQRFVSEYTPEGFFSFNFRWWK